MEQNTINITESNREETDQYPKDTTPAIVYSVLVVVFTVVAGFGLMYLNDTQTKKVVEINKQTQVIEKEIAKIGADGDLLSEAKRLTNAAAGYKKYKMSELDWQTFLTDVQEQTLSEVTYTSFAIDRNKSTFRMDGVAPSYRIIAEQLNQFMLDEKIARAGLKNAILRPQSESASRVSFSFELKPAKDAFVKVVETTAESQL